MLFRTVARLMAGVRGKYARSYREGTNVVLIDPDLHELNRIVVWINYPYRVAYGRFIGTHAEYDRIDAQTV